MRTPTTSKPRTLRVRNPTDLLALVPYTFGFHPRDSLVLITGEADQQCHARVDLPGRAAGGEIDGAEVEEMCSYLASVAGRNRARWVVLVLYTADAGIAAAVHERLVGCLDRVGCRAGLALRADHGRWWSLTPCTDACADDCCPAGGTAYDISSHAFTAQGVLEGQVTHGSREELAASLAVLDRGALARVEAAVDQLSARRKGSRRLLVAEGHWVEDRIRRYLEDGEPLDAVDVGRLLVALASIEVRDVAWARMCRADAAEHVALWRDVVSRSPEDLVAPAAALLGFAAWLAGDGALAWCAVDRCQNAAPDYTLARLLTQTLAGAVPPSSWRPLPREALSLFAD